MSDLGSDFDTPDGELKADMRLLETDQEKILAWLQALARRLQQPRGSLWYDLDYGLDIRTYVSDDEEPAVAAHDINQECLKDERTGTCLTDISVQPDGSWLVNTTPSTRDGAAYSLTFLVTESKIELLRTSQNSP